MRQKDWMQRKSQNNAFKEFFRVIGTFALFASLCLVTALPAVAADEVAINDVIINGYKLGFFEQLALENHIDQDIPDGEYWFELDTGMWGPVGGSAIGHIDVPEDYQEYVKTRFNKQNQSAQVELSSAAEECDTGCVYW